MSSTSQSHLSSLQLLSLCMNPTSLQKFEISQMGKYFLVQVSQVHCPVPNLPTNIFQAFQVPIHSFNLDLLPWKYPIGVEMETSLSSRACSLPACLPSSPCISPQGVPEKVYNKIVQLVLLSWPKIDRVQGRECRSKHICLLLHVLPCSLFIFGHNRGTSWKILL